MRLPTGGFAEYHVALDVPIARRAVRVETLRAAVAKHDRGWRRRLALADVLFASGRWDEAVAEYRLVTRRQPGALRAWLRLAEPLHGAGRADEACEALKAALAQEWSEATACHLRGLLARCRRDPQLAAREFGHAIELAPRDLAHHHALADMWTACEHHVEAAAAFDRALRVDPDDLYSLGRSYNALTHTGRWDEMIGRLERAVARDPYWTYAAKLLGDARASMGLVRGKEGRRTRQILDRVLARSPDSADAWDAMCQYHRHRGEYDRTIAIYRAFVGRNPRNADGWRLFGTALEYAGKTRAAARAYIRSHALNPDEVDVYWRGMDCIFDAGFRDLAKQWMDEALRRFPRSWGVLQRCALFCSQLAGDPDRAIALARRAVGVHPLHGPAHACLAEVLIAAGHGEEAVLEAREAARLQPRSDITRASWLPYLLGSACRAAGNEAEARRSFRESERIAREDARRLPWAICQVGRAREALGDLRGAERAYVAALRSHALWAEADLERVRSELAGVGIVRSRR